MYLLDSNTYIQAKNLHYQMSFCPAYWEWLDMQYQASVIASIQPVYEELVSGDDELAAWVKERKTQFVAVSSDNIQEKFAEIAQYVAEQEGKKHEHIAEFLAHADPWLIATAAVNGATVVTHESLVPENSTKLKIPNICQVFQVPFLNTFKLLQDLEARFVLG